MVTKCIRRVAFISLMIAESVVLLPDPVGPVTSTSPERIDTIFLIGSGSPSCATVISFVGMIRTPPPMPALLLEEVHAKARDPGHLVGEVHVTRAHELAPEVRRSDGLEQPAKSSVERAVANRLHATAQTKDGGTAHREVQVARAAVVHQLEKAVDAVLPGGARRGGHHGLHGRGGLTAQQPQGVRVRAERLQGLQELRRQRDARARSLRGARRPWGDRRAVGCRDGRGGGARGRRGGPRRRRRGHGLQRHSDLFDRSRGVDHGGGRRRRVGAGQHDPLLHEGHRVGPERSNGPLGGVGLVHRRDLHLDRGGRGAALGRTGVLLLEVVEVQRLGVLGDLHPVGAGEGRLQRQLFVRDGVRRHLHPGDDALVLGARLRRAGGEELRRRGTRAIAEGGRGRPRDPLLGDRRSRAALVANPHAGVSRGDDLHGARRAVFFAPGVLRARGARAQRGLARAHDATPLSRASNCSLFSARMYAVSAVISPASRRSARLWSRVCIPWAREICMRLGS
jgi:hypothetical protein